MLASEFGDGDGARDLPSGLESRRWVEHGASRLQYKGLVVDWYLGTCTEVPWVMGHAVWFGDIGLDLQYSGEINY